MKEQKVMFLDDNRRVDNRRYVIYYSPHPEKASHNGLYIVRARLCLTLSHITKDRSTSGRKRAGVSAFFTRN